MLNLTSFEPLILGVRNLIDMALGSSQPGGPRFLFISSISAVRSEYDVECIHHVPELTIMKTIPVQPQSQKLSIIALTLPLARDMARVSGWLNKS